MSTSSKKIDDIKYRTKDTSLINTEYILLKMFEKDSTFASVSEVIGTYPRREVRLHVFIQATIVTAMAGLATA